jgi:hypothetical protein
MPAGRPSDYDPSYCEKVIEWGAQGKSRTWMAAKLGTHRQRLYVWEEAHPEFKDALMQAKALEQLWWEDKGQECLVMAQGSSFSQTAWSRSMAARFPDDWREKVDNNVSGTLQVSEVKRTVVDPGNPDA